MQDQVFRLRTIVMVVASICAAPQIASAEVVEGETVEVVSTTPLAGIGLPAA